MTRPATIDASNTIDATDFKSIMGTLCKTVTVVTTMAGDRPHGTTVSAFSSLSLEPAMISVALDRKSRLLAYAEQTGRIGVNFLGTEQGDLALAMAGKGQDKFDSVDWSLCDGLPRIGGALGWLACDIAQFVPGGDHVVLFGTVTHTAHEKGLPLVYGHKLFGTHSALLTPR